MNREDIIRIAQECQFAHYYESGDLVAMPQLERFAALVAKHEREACAKVCEGLGVHPALNVFNGGPEWYKHGKDCAVAIRARGEK